MTAPETPLQVAALDLAGELRAALAASQAQVAELRAMLERVTRILSNICEGAGPDEDDDCKAARALLARTEPERKTPRK